MGLETGLLTRRAREEIAKRKDMTDAEVRELITELSFQTDEYMLLGCGERHSLCERAFCSLRCEYGVLQPLIEDSSVTEIMVNGASEVFIEQNGRVERSDMYFESTEELEDIIRKMAAGVRREINEMVPIVDARLSDGSRVNAVYKSIALGGPVLTIRKFPERPFTMEDFISFGS
ncbi:MAG: CpaF family protein, partial [Firmicutes bacterium]|nr:CpaF family protein [Bacillota bacterium]